MTENEFIDKIRETVAQYEMVSKGETVCVGLSGGADSVSLLHALKKLGDELGFKVRAVHINHGLRGEESERDMRFCERLCGELGIDIEVRRLNLAAAKEKHESLEECARKARYEAFAEVVGEDRLATAHNLNDSAETVLLNLMRGTGLKGLCGIPPKRGNIIRPLIRCSRAEVEEYCRVSGLSYVTDSTNLSDDYTRNKVRHRIIPEMLKINPALPDVISRMTELLREDSDYLEALAEKALADSAFGMGYRAEELARLPNPIKSRAVRKILSDGGIEPSALRINTAISLLNKRSARFNPCRNRFFTIRRGICFVEKVEQHYKKHYKNP